MVTPLVAVADAIEGVAVNIFNGFNYLFSQITGILDYLNPFSQNFFIRIALVPSDGYLQGKIDELKTNMDNKFVVYGQIKDTVTSVRESHVDAQNWEGIKADFSNYGIGEIEIVNPEFIKLAGPKLKFWISGLIWFVTGLYVIRKITVVWGVSSGDS